MMTTLKFVRISTMAFEQRPTTKMKLNEKGNLEQPGRFKSGGEDSTTSDVQSSISPSQKACLRKDFPLG